MYLLDDFDFTVPPHLIAQAPFTRKGEAQLLVRQQEGGLLDLTIDDLPRVIPQDALLVVNETKVFPSRLHGQLATGGRVEVFLLSRLCGKTQLWQALAKPLKKLPLGRTIRFASGVVGTVRARQEHGSVVEISFALPAELDWDLWLWQSGRIPLPPYIKRDGSQAAIEEQDRAWYQTVYAREQGSVAAPTAGLHFNQDILQRLRRNGVEVAPIILHVGLGTFQPVRAKQVADHAMHTEKYCVPKDTWEKIARAKAEGRKIIAVGTTSLRAITSFYRHRDLEEACDRWLETNLFLYPQKGEAPQKPALIDGLMTNFHQPKSTLFMLVCALIGIDAAKAMYQHAVQKRYRFFSYGDSSILWF